MKERPQEEVQRKLIEWLKSQIKFYATSRMLRVNPVERYEQLQFFNAALSEVERLVEFERGHAVRAETTDSR